MQFVFGLKFVDCDPGRSKEGAHLSWNRRKTGRRAGARAGARAGGGWVGVRGGRVDGRWDGGRGGEGGRAGLYVGVGHGERAPTAVAGRARQGAGRLRPDAQQAGPDLILF